MAGELGDKLSNIQSRWGILKFSEIDSSILSKHKSLKNVVITQSIISQVSFLIVLLFGPHLPSVDRNGGGGL